MIKEEKEWEHCSGTYGMVERYTAQAVACVGCGCDEGGLQIFFAIRRTNVSKTGLYRRCYIGDVILIFK